MDIFDRTPCSDVKGNTPVTEQIESNVGESESVTQVVSEGNNGEETSPKVTPKSNQVKQNNVEPEIKSNHGVVQTAEPKPEKEVMTEYEIYALNKTEQISILKELGAEEIPHYEKDRVALIVKLQ